MSAGTLPIRLTRDQAQALSRLIRLQLAAYAEAEQPSGAAGDENLEPISPEELDLVEPLLGMLAECGI